MELLAGLLGLVFVSMGGFVVASVRSVHRPRPYAMRQYLAEAPAPALALSTQGVTVVREVSEPRMLEAV